MKQSTLVMALQMVRDDDLMRALGREILKRMAAALVLGLILGVLLGWMFL